MPIQILDELVSATEDGYIADASAIRGGVNGVMNVAGQDVTALTLGPGLTSSVADGVAKLDPTISLATKYNRRTYLDDWVMGGQRCPPRVRAILQRASIICPFFARDRYWDAAGSVWRSRNYGTLGSGVIVGDATYQTIQLKYTDEGKGVESNGGASLVRIPAAWIDTTLGFTVLIRYQRPLAHTNYAHLVSIGDVGGTANGNGQARFYARALTTDVLATNTGSLPVPATSLNPRVLVCSANDAGITAPLSVYLDGALVATGNKMGYALTGLDHLLGGFWLNNVAMPSRYWNILDFIVVPGELNASEVALLTEAVQFNETPAVDILTGQSNMVGPGKPSTGEPMVLPTLPIKNVAYRDECRDATWDRGWSDCDMAPLNYFGPELTICAARPNRVVIKYGRNGTISNAWTDVDTYYYPYVTEYLMRALWTLSCKPRVENIVFMQGETDAEVVPETMTAANRQARVTAIASMLRTGLNRTPAQCRFVAVRINSAIATFPSIKSYDNVRAGDAAFVAADANARLVDTDGLAYRANDLHYANQGILDAGTRIAAQMQTL